MEDGDPYNLTGFSMCAHNGTYIDAPFHFFADGAAAEELPLEEFWGATYTMKAQKIKFYKNPPG